VPTEGHPYRIRPCVIYLLGFVTIRDWRLKVGQTYIIAFCYTYRLARSIIPWNQLMHSACLPQVCERSDEALGELEDRC
jgi:hypothetical protein